METGDVRLGFWKMAAAQGPHIKVINIWVTLNAWRVVGIPHTEKVEQKVQLGFRV